MCVKKNGMDGFFRGPHLIINIKQGSDQDHHAGGQLTERLLDGKAYEYPNHPDSGKNCSLGQADGC
jgi:hypothetical protein